MRLERRGWGAARLLAALCLLWGAGSPAGAEEKTMTVHQHLAKVRQDWIAAGRPNMVEKVAESPAFGTDSVTAVEVQAYAFQPAVSTDTVLDDGNGYRYFGGESVLPYLSAPVQVPSGVVIDFIKFSLCGSVAGDFTLGLFDNGTSGAANVPIGTLVSGNWAGCANVSLGPLNYTYAQTAHHPLYFVLLWGPNAIDGSAKFNNAQVYYRRIVAPAPANAAFNDVPTSHPFFQFVEALRASGITGGCGNDNYCPDNPVTRGQMAVFLAKALGLHWPN